MDVNNYAPDWLKHHHSCKRCCQDVNDVIEETSHRSHYQQVTPQPIEVINEWLTDEQFVGFCLGTSIKYIGRYNLKSAGKGGVKDIAKAIDYLEWAQERLLLSTKR